MERSNVAHRGSESIDRNGQRMGREEESAPLVIHVATQPLSVLTRLTLQRAQTYQKSAHLQTRTPGAQLWSKQL